MSFNTTGKTGKDRILVALTIFPVTDFIGANYFYLGNMAVGFIKLVLSLFLIWTIYSIFGGEHGFGVIGLIVVGLFLLSVNGVWWISDIYRVCIKSDLK